MKKILTLLILSVFILQSCDFEIEEQIEEVLPTSPITVITENGDGWTWYRSHIDVDSVQMISLKEADIYINGTKQKIFADQISITTNKKYKNKIE